MTPSSIRNRHPFRVRDRVDDVTIVDANHAGMRIEGILVTELLRVYRQQSAAPEAEPGGAG